MPLPTTDSRLPGAYSPPGPARLPQVALHHFSVNQYLWSQTIPQRRNFIPSRGAFLGKLIIRAPPQTMGTIVSCSRSEERGQRIKCLMPSNINASPAIATGWRVDTIAAVAVNGVSRPATRPRKCRSTWPTLRNINRNAAGNKSQDGPQMRRLRRRRRSEVVRSKCSKVPLASQKHCEGFFNMTCSRSNGRSRHRLANLPNV